jgi:molybdopterin/thiamine biosynthesis adenylyltransferase
LRCCRHFPEDNMQSNISGRYFRQLTLKGFGAAAQEKLLSSKVLVIGAGGLGCPALQYLAAAGTGTLGIVDFDKVSLTNLHRQILYSDNDIGALKAEKAKNYLQNLNPEITLISYTDKITHDNANQIIDEYDLVIDATDNIESRYIINDACVFLKKPFILGAIHEYQGQVAILNYADKEINKTVNYRDVFPNLSSGTELPNCEANGALGVLCGIIGTMQANEAIKLIAGIGTPLINKLLTYDSLTNETYIVDLL